MATPNDWELIFGDQPNEQAQMLSNLLRRRQAMGDIVGLVGGKPLQPMAQSLGRSADEGLDRLAKVGVAKMGVEAGWRDRQMENQLQIARERNAANVLAAMQRNQAQPEFDWSPEAIDQAADRFARWGVMPAMGMGNRPAVLKLRSQITGRAAEMYPGVDFGQVQAGNKADQTALSQLRGQEAKLMAFQDTLMGNIDNFLQTVRSVPDAGSPLLNRPLRWAAQQVKGDPAMAKFMTGAQIVATEVARQLQGNMVGVLSDAAREEAMRLIRPEDATANQIAAAFEIIRADLPMRQRGFTTQAATIENRMRTRLPPRGKQPAAAAEPGGIPTVNTPEEARQLPKGTKFRTPDGRIMER